MLSFTLGAASIQKEPLSMFISGYYPKMLETKLLKELVSEAKMPEPGEGGGGRGGSGTGR